MSLSVFGRKWEETAQPGRLPVLPPGLELPDPVLGLLAARGLTEPEELNHFLSPRLKDLGDPFLLPSMPEAVDRILAALDRHERVAVYGDYDVDGLTSTALLTRVIERLGGDVRPFLPDRMEEGYGLSADGLSRCLDACQPKLLITVDCGTGSVESVQQARAAGVDVVVTDHHEPHGELPDCPVVNPKLGDDDSVRFLAGVGVAYKLCHALVKAARERGMRTATALDLREFLEWVALGTVCDIVPLRHENRILAHAGLKYMRRHTGLGLTALIKVAGIHRDALSAYHLGYQLGPRLNAVGRMGSAVVGLDLLLSKDPQQAEALAQELDRANRERQEVEKQTLAQAETDVATAFEEGREAPFSIVANGPGWHRGVVGIVASRLCRKYNRPAIVIGMDEDGMGRGSCRSIEGFDLMQALEQCGDLLEAFGGHRMAAGLEVSQDNLKPFRERFEQAAREQLSEADLVPVQRIDGWVRSEDLEDWVLMDAQKQLAPFGSEHPRPVWALHDARSASAPRPVGKEGDHLKFSFMGSSGAHYSGIGFGMGKMTLPPEPWDVAFYLQENHFRGETHLDLVVQDIR